MLEHLIAPQFFPEILLGMHWSLLLLVTAASLFALTIGADWLVAGASGLAYRMGVPKVIVAATIVSLGTTTPECAVSVFAAWNGNAGLALGNAVGSIIADTGLIFGLGCLMVALPADRFLLSRQGWVQFGSAVLLAIVCYSAFAIHGNAAAIERWAGIFFLLLLAVYMAVSLRWSKQQLSADLTDPPITDEANEQTDSEHSPNPGHRGRALAILSAYFVVGLVLVVISSEVLIHAVSELARQIGVPQLVIAATIVAFGTSLPELVVGLQSIRRGHPELLVGNVIGADILNVLFVVGASAFAAPLPIIEPTAPVPAIFLLVHLPTMLVMLLLFRVFIAFAIRRRRFRRAMGWPLLGIYVVFVILTWTMSLGA